jgi:hypothetical protein
MERSRSTHDLSPWRRVPRAAEPASSIAADTGVSAKSTPRPRRVALLTYATSEYVPQQRVVVSSARKMGITDSIAWDRPMLERTDFYARHRDVLDRRKGGGLWLWKPYLINRELQRLAPGDFLVYSDCGYPWRPLVIRQPLQSLLHWCETKNGGLLPGVYVPRHGANRKWTKHECFVAMQCDSDNYWRQPQIQATFSVWQKCALAESFAAEWLRWCVQPVALSDEKLMAGVHEYPEFIDHRYDQSILTNLALMHGIRCFGGADEIHSETKYIDNLSDRITGRSWRIHARNLSRRIVSETKKHWLQWRPQAH